MRICSGGKWPVKFTLWCGTRLEVQVSSEAGWSPQFRSKLLATEAEDRPENNSRQKPRSVRGTCRERRRRDVTQVFSKLDQGQLDERTVD